MKKVVFFSITENTDKTEGRGVKKDTGIGFTNYDDALDFVESDHYKSRFGIMGTKGSQYDIDSKEIHVFESINDFELNYQKLDEDRKMAQILKKLEPKEIEFLKNKLSK